MTQVRIRGRDAVTLIGEEAVAFGTTAASMIRAFPVTTDDGGGVDVSGLMTAEEEVEDESVFLPDVKPTVQGLEGGPVKGYNVDLRPEGTQLISGVAVTDSYIGCAMRAAWGGEYPPVGQTNGGAVVAAAGSTTTSLVLTAGQGARVFVGEVVGVQTSNGLEFAQIVALATDTATLNPALIGTPTASTGIVVGCRTWGLSQDNTRSVTIEHAKAMNAAYQWRANGCCVNMSGLSLEIGKIPKLSFDIESASHIGPEALSISQAAAANPMAAPICVRGSTVLLVASSAAAVRTTQYTIEAFAPKFNPFMGHAPGMGNDIEGKVACQVLGTRSMAELALTVSADTSQFTNWSAKTLMGFYMFNLFGSGTTRRASGLIMPTCEIVGEPVISVKGKRTIMDFKLRPMLNTTTTTSGLSSTALYFAKSPVYVFTG